MQGFVFVGTQGRFGSRYRPGGGSALLGRAARGVPRMAKRGLACVICTSWLEAAGLAGKWPATGKDLEENGAGLHAAGVLAAWSALGQSYKCEKSLSTLSQTVDGSDTGPIHVRACSRHRAVHL